MINIISIDELSKRSNFQGLLARVAKNEWPPFEPISILALEILEKLGKTEPTHQQVNDAEKIIRLLLDITQCDVKLSEVPTLQEILIKVTDSFFDKTVNIEMPLLPEIKIIPRIASNESLPMAHGVPHEKSAKVQQRK